MAEANSSDLEPNPKPQVVYRCKKCRRIVAAQENIVPHKRGLNLASSGEREVVTIWMSQLSAPPYL